MVGEGEYNLNDLIEVEATDSYLGLDQEVKQCQEEEPFHNCTTRHYIDTILKHCKCLPLNIRLLDKVYELYDICISVLYPKNFVIGTPLHLRRS